MADFSLPFKQAVTGTGTGFEIDNTWPGDPKNALEAAGPAIQGSSVTGIGLSGQSAGKLGFSAGVYGLNTSAGPAVIGVNEGSGSGVEGTSQTNDAVIGTTASDAHAGVAGHNTSTGAKGGVGVYGTGGQYAGKFDGNVLVNGNFIAVSTKGRAISATCSDPGADCINGTSSASLHAGVSANNTAVNGYGLWATSTQGTGIWAQGATYAAWFEGNVQVNGQHYCTGDIQVAGDVVLVNAVSGDVAEDFDLEDDGESAEPGTVLVIAPDGKLRVCDESYDSRLAGVVSGAGELRPAVVLQRIETAAPRSPIALVGKAYCKVDASYGRINAGDLLTTSPTRGHAMKVADRSKALGAVLGKALRAHEEGRGLIPILISPR